MKPIFKAIHRTSSGFTLVELLVVFALLALLSAIVIPNVANLVGYGRTEAPATELSVLQTAMDSMMARARIDSVNATGATNDMSVFPTGSPLYPGYLRKEQTKGTYSCSTTGLISQNSTGY